MNLRKDWDPNMRNIIHEAKWLNIQFVRHVVGEAVQTGAITISYCSNWCEHVSQDGFVRFFVEDCVHHTKCDNTVVWHVVRYFREKITMTVLDV